MSSQPTKKKHPEEMPILPPIPMAAADDPARAVQQQPTAMAESEGSEKAAYTAHAHRNVARHRFLSPAEWTRVASGIGGIGDGEQRRSVHPSSWWWPPKGMPPGLYRDIVRHRHKFYCLFHLFSIARWSLLVLQLLIGAALTSLGTLSLRDGTPITILGAINTVIAGFLAMLHNSGLPERFRHDMIQFEELEDHVKEILDSGIAPVGHSTDQVLAECFDVFREAKATVAANMPVNYNSRQVLRSGKQGLGSVVTPMPLPPLDAKPPYSSRPAAGAEASAKDATVGAGASKHS